MIDACAQEQIQFLGHVQDFGCLLVITTQWVVRNASVNTEAVLGLAPDVLIAQRLFHRPAADKQQLRARPRAHQPGQSGDQVVQPQPGQPAAPLRWPPQPWGRGGR